MKPPIADRYRLDEIIAAGGMGTVWRAYDTRLDRPVAVKLLRETALHDAESARRRFEREAKAAATLQGTGFAAVHDHGEAVVDGEQVAYLVMELIDGESLSELVKRDGALSPDRTMAFTAAVADTLQTVHDEGIIHRDIKPGNILIDRGGEVKLVDFGIARINDVTSLTSTGIALGTLSYASPEQLNMGALTGATDVYSLGAVAYQCLTGRPPFDSADRAAVIAGHLNASPPPLPRHVPDLVAHVVLIALEKDPRNRWESASEFARACRDAAAGERSVLIRRTRSKPARQGMWSWRGGFIAVSVAAALLLTTALAWSPLVRGDDTPDVAENTAASAVDVDPTASTDPSESADPTPSASVSVPQDGAPGGDGDEAGDASDEPGAGPSGVGGGEDAGEGEGTGTGGGDAGEGGGTGGGQPDSTSGTVPDMVGMSTHDAKDVLRGRGFTNVQGQAQGWGEGANYLPAACEVLSQTPEPGTAQDSGDPVRLTYYYGTGGTDCGFPRWNG